MSKIIRYITEEEAEKCLTWIIKWSEYPLLLSMRARNTTLFLLMLDAGLRVSEVAGLNQNQLLFDSVPVTSILIPRNTCKNNPERNIPVSKRLCEAIKDLAEFYWRIEFTKPHEHAFFGRDMTMHMSIRQIQRVISYISLCALGKEIYPHTLRHTFANRLRKVTDIRVVQNLLGHKNLSSTQIYTHPAYDESVQAIKSLGCSFAENVIAGKVVPVRKAVKS